MSNLVYFLQEGTDGPVKVLAASSPDAVAPAIRRMQHGNPQPLLLRAQLSDPDGDLTIRLHARYHRHLIRGDWFRAAVLDDIPDAQSIPFDSDAEAAKLAAIRLEQLANARGS